MNNNNLKISHINARSIKNKFHKICKMINNEGIDILSINETYLTSKDTQYDLINDFNVVRCDRQYSNGGGIAVLLRKSIKFNIIKKISNHNEEYIILELNKISNTNH